MTKKLQYIIIINIKKNSPAPGRYGSKEKKMTKAEILNGKTRKELAVMIGIAYMNQFNKSEESGKRVMEGWLKGFGMVKAATKPEMIKKVLADEAKGFMKIA